jgi:hypothetical protein
VEAVDAHSKHNANITQNIVRRVKWSSEPLLSSIIPFAGSADKHGFCFEKRSSSG